MPTKPWPFPEKPLPVKTLDRMLRVLSSWSEEQREPVVGRIREERRDPFAVLVGTMLSLRTRDAATEKAFSRLWRLAPDPLAMAGLPPGRIEEAIRPVGFYKVKARSLSRTARLLLDRHAGRVPKTMEELLSLPGVGRKTANLVLTEGFGLPGICVDTHVHRILNWWGYVRTHSPDETERILRETLPDRWWIPVNGILVTFGQAVCRPVAPRCAECPVARLCPYPAKRTPREPSKR